MHILLNILYNTVTKMETVQSSKKKNQWTVFKDHELKTQGETLSIL